MALSAQELASIQSEAVSKACDKTCGLYRKVTTRGTSGEPLAQWNLLSMTPCGIAQPTAGQLQNYDFMIGSLSAWQVKLPVGTDVHEQDHIMIDGQTLEVQVVLAPRSYASLLTCLASEIK